MSQCKQKTWREPFYVTKKFELHICILLITEQMTLKFGWLLKFTRKHCKKYNQIYKFSSQVVTMPVLVFCRSFYSDTDGQYLIKASKRIKNLKVMTNAYFTVSLVYLIWIEYEYFYMSVPNTLTSTFWKNQSKRPSLTVKYII